LQGQPSLEHPGIGLVLYEPHQKTIKGSHLP
jgi:hypothetical protein